MNGASWPFQELKRRLYNTLGLEAEDALLLVAQPNITYLTGMRDPSGALVSTSSCGDVIITSVLDYHRILRQAPRDVDVEAVGRSGEESLRATIVPKIYRKSLIERVGDYLHECGVKRVFYDRAWLQAALADSIEHKLSKNIELVDASEKIAKTRSVKTDFEVELILKAISVAESALKKAINELDAEASEASIAGTILSTMLELGAWGPSFPPIVAFHDHTAYPHHAPTPRLLGPQGAVLIDLGAIYGGLMSDMTRTLWHGGGEPRRFREALEAVVEAHDTAIDVVAPGVTAGEVDRAARAVLEKYGLDGFFIHGLGHGVGVEIHERPYLRPGSSELLEPGMVVTIEPGVYVPGLYGIRVEDMVLVTKKGARMLTRFSPLIV